VTHIRTQKQIGVINLRAVKPYHQEQKMNTSINTRLSRTEVMANLTGLTLKTVIGGRFAIFECRGQPLEIVS
jgi:hypothetical protein